MCCEVVQIHNVPMFRSLIPNTDSKFVHIQYMVLLGA